MKRQLQCFKCKTTMRVAYIREGKKWRRIAWACARCGAVEPAFMQDFRPHRKARIT